MDISSFSMARPLRPFRDVLAEWTPDLARKLGRSVEAIASHGLTADDFHIDRSVEVRDPDGTQVAFKFAFAVVRPFERLAAVFTEHDGYLEFDLVEDAVVAEIVEDIYRQR
jgi:hypothetical protein